MQTSSPNWPYYKAQSEASITVHVRYGFQSLTPIPKSHRNGGENFLAAPREFSEGWGGRIAAPKLAEATD